MILHAITDFSSSKRGKWLVILAWVVATAIIVPLAPSLDDVTENDDASFLPSGSESLEVSLLVDERFPNSGTPAIIVFHNPGGLSEADFAAEAELSAWLLSGEAGDNVESVVSVSTVPAARAELVSPDGTTMNSVVNITGEPAEEPYLDTIDRIREQTAQLDEGGEGLAVKVSGPGGLLADLVEVFANIDGFLLLVTASLVLVLLIVIYRSPVVALVPLVSVGWVFALAGAAGALLAEAANLPVNGQATGIMTVILFGAGTDYCLFIASRYREELHHTQDTHLAMRATMRAVSESIASAAGTFLVATIALLLASLRSNQALGPLLAVAIGVMLIAALTLVPAILTILGRASFWPFRPQYDPAAIDAEPHGIWARIATIVSHRPVATLVTTVGLFVLMALGVLTIKVDYDSLASLPSDSESVQGFELLRQGFPPGELSPTEAYVVLPSGVVYDPENLAAVDSVTLSLAAATGVVESVSPSRPFGAQSPVGPQQVLDALTTIPPDVKATLDSGGPPPSDLNPNSPLGEAIGIYAASSRLVSPDGGVARINATLDVNPYSIEALDLVPGLRDAARDGAESAGLSRDDVLVGGETAVAYDTRAANNRDELVVLPLILLFIGIILGLLLRSIVAPIYLMATIVLSYFAALGLSVVIFQNVLGQSGTGPSVPFFLFVFLVALGVDYNIFLMARVREETRKLGLRAGTTRALARTGGVITSAGLILAGTFASLMTLPLRDLFQLGFAVALGVLLDTFIVRTLMVPSIVLLLGKWNWWPFHPKMEE